jgi:hypothetical protein
VDGSVGVRALQGLEDRRSNDGAAANAMQGHGLASWVMGLLRGLGNQRERTQKHLRLVETLPLGGKRQLMLVTCAGQSFLVGGGLESVETIVQLKAGVSPSAATKGVDEPCR